MTDVDPTQAAAFIQAQSTACYVELVSMITQNDCDRLAGRPSTYTPQAFLDLIDKYGLGQNAILSTYQEANRYRT